MKHVILYREKDCYCSFPHVVCLPGERLLVAFRKAGRFSAGAARQGLVTHHDPDSSIEIVESEDGGFTWAAASRTIYKSNYGVNDPALTMCRDGTLLCRFVALNIVPTGDVGTLDRPIFSHRTEHGLVTTVEGNIVLASRDGGKRWDEVGIANTPTLKYSCSRDPIVEMSDGSLLMPVYTGAPQRSDMAWVIRSFDKGRTWHHPVVVMVDPEGERSQLQGINYNEMSLLDLGKGELLALVRGDASFHTSGDQFMPVGGCGELYTSKSYDSGLSWEFPKRSGLWGQPGALTRLNNGDILATYGYRRNPFGVRGCISRDGGRSWLVDKEIVIRSEGPTWDIGYPFSIQLENGRIFSVYYWVDEEGVRFIAGTHWELS